MTSSENFTSKYMIGDNLVRQSIALVEETNDHMFMFEPEIDIEGVYPGEE